MKILDNEQITFNHRSRRILAQDLLDFDYILALDSQVLRSIWSMGKHKAKVESLLKYSSNSQYSDVPDPISTGRFDLVNDLVADSCKGLLASIRTIYNL
jgi:protein-tyrosine-phosphatase